MRYQGARFFVLGFVVCAAVVGLTWSEPAAVEIEYLEIVTPEVDATIATLEKLHGVRFSDPVAEFGNARTAPLEGGGRISVRGPTSGAMRSKRPSRPPGRAGERSPTRRWRSPARAPSRSISRVGTNTGSGRTSCRPRPRRAICLNMPVNMPPGPRSL